MFKKAPWGGGGTGKREQWEMAITKQHPAHTLFANGDKEGGDNGPPSSPAYPTMPTSTFAHFAGTKPSGSLLLVRQRGTSVQQTGKLASRGGQPKCFYLSLTT